jgi:hypothetical protein
MNDKGFGKVKSEKGKLKRGVEGWTLKHLKKI